MVVVVADHGCHVYLGSRNKERGMRAVEEVKASSGDSVELLQLVSAVNRIVYSYTCHIMM